MHRSHWLKLGSGGGLRERKPGLETLESRQMLHHCIISFSSATYTVGEGAGSAVIVLTRDVAAGDISVDFSAAAGTAGSGDFTPIDSQTVFWANSDPNTKTVTVNIANDALVEGNESIQLSLDNFQLTSPGEFDSAVLTIVDDDSGGGNDAPAISNFGGVRTFTENGAAVAISPNATITDGDSANFASGKLTVKYTNSGGANDRLFIRNTTNLTTNASNQVLFAGNVIGTFTGGTGTTPLVVTFNNQATPAIATTLQRNILYRNVSDNPGATRTVSVTVSDGDGGTSAAVSKSLNVTRVNDVPVLGISGTIGYQRGAPAVVLASGATLSDPDSSNFAGGFLRVRIAVGGGPSNTLAVGSGFTVDASGNVRQGTTLIGTRTSNGVGTNELRITFNSNATKAVVQSLIRSITYRNVGGSAGQRKIEFTVNDGDGGTSVPKVKTVNVS